MKFWSELELAHQVDDVNFFENFENNILCIFNKLFFSRGNQNQKYFCVMVWLKIRDRIWSNLQFWTFYFSKLSCDICCWHHSFFGSYLWFKLGFNFLSILQNVLLFLFFSSFNRNLTWLRNLNVIHARNLHNFVFANSRVTF